VDGFHKGLPVCGVSLNALFLAQVYRVNTNLRRPSCP